MYKTDIIFSASVLIIRISRPTSGKRFSNDVSLIAPVIAIPALYWKDSRFVRSSIIDYVTIIYVRPDKWSTDCH